jgi:hypothetical protein
VMGESEHWVHAAHYSGRHCEGREAA